MQSFLDLSGGDIHHFDFIGKEIHLATVMDSFMCQFGSVIVLSQTTVGETETQLSKF